MDSKTIISSIKQSGIVAVVRAENSDTASKIADACLAGGVNCIEITFTVPDAVGVIKALKSKYSENEIILGAGTVMNVSQARTALYAGAQFIVSPYLDTETVRFCKNEGVAVIPGVMTVREAVMAMNAGADILKIFPAELFGPAIIKAFHGPLPDAVMMPTGGVTAENCGEWIRAGAVAVGAGGSLTGGAKTGNYAEITETARRFVQNIAEARG